MATNEHIIDPLIDLDDNSNNISKRGCITRIGSKTLNANFFNEYRKVVILGAKIGRINDVETYRDTIDDYDAFARARETLVSEEFDGSEPRGIVQPEKNRYIPIGSMSTEFTHNANNEHHRLLISFTFSKDSLLGYEKPVQREPDNLDSPSDIHDFHEIGIYGQVYQKASSWVLGETYHAGDFVEVCKTGRFFRAIYSGDDAGHVASDDNKPIRDDKTVNTSYWMEYEFNSPPKRSTYETKDVTWIPVWDTETDAEVAPFLLYYVGKFEYPICIEYGHHISYMLAIEMQSGDMTESFYIEQEDTIAFPEIQLAYLATLCNSLRSARDVHRENAVLRSTNARGRWRDQTAYEVGDIVVSQEWLPNSGWDGREWIWKCQRKQPITSNQVNTYSKPYSYGGSNTGAWERLDIRGNRDIEELRNLILNREGV